VADAAGSAVAAAPVAVAVARRRRVERPEAGAGSTAAAAAAAGAGDASVSPSSSERARRRERVLRPGVAAAAAAGEEAAAAVAASCICSSACCANARLSALISVHFVSWLRKGTPSPSSRAFSCATVSRRRDDAEGTSPEPGAAAAEEADEEEAIEVTGAIEGYRRRGGMVGSGQPAAAVASGRCGPSGQVRRCGAVPRSLERQASQHCQTVDAKHVRG